MSKNLDYYQARLQEIREVLNIIYLQSFNYNNKKIVHIRNKFDRDLVRINSKILKESISSKNSIKLNLGNPSYNSHYVPLCQKYLKIIDNIHVPQNEIFVIQQLKLQSSILEKEAMELKKIMDNLPEVPKNLDKNINKSINKRKIGNKPNNLTLKII